MCLVPVPIVLFYRLVSLDSVSVREPYYLDSPLLSELERQDLELGWYHNHKLRLLPGTK